MAIMCHVKLRSALKLAAHLVREDRAMARAMKGVPRPIPWEYARPRIVPIIAGPRFDREGEEVMRSTAGPGCAVEFAIDLRTAFPRVDRLVAERWECTSDQLRDVGLANLRRRLDRLTPTAATPGTLSGRIVRMLQVPHGFAASALLMTDQLVRLFGSHDQLFAPITPSWLISFPMEMPPSVIASTVAELESEEEFPLLLDPFLLEAGELLWQPAGELDPDDRE